MCVQLVSKISNLCDHKSPSQTDRRTDRRHAIPRPRICNKVHCAVKTRYFGRKTRKNTAFWQNHRFTAFDENHSFCDFCVSVIFTAQCTLVQSAVLRSHVACLSVRLSVCPSVTLVICDHIGLEILETNCTVYQPNTFAHCSQKAIHLLPW